MSDDQMLNRIIPCLFAELDDTQLQVRLEVARLTLHPPFHVFLQRLIVV